LISKGAEPMVFNTNIGWFCSISAKNSKVLHYQTVYAWLVAKVCDLLTIPVTSPTPDVTAKAVEECIVPMSKLPKKLLDYHCKSRSTINS
jgi:hypothetical protein